MIIKSVRHKNIICKILLLLIFLLVVFPLSFYNNAQAQVPINCTLNTNNMSSDTLGCVFVNLDNEADINKIFRDIIRSGSKSIIQITCNYNLNGKVIEIPQNCILNFVGGSFSNGTFIGNHTCIIAPPTLIFGNNIVIKGDWNIDHSYPEWFGAKGDGYSDDRLPIQLSLNYFQTTRLLPHKYSIKSFAEINNVNYGLIIPPHHNLEASGFFDFSRSSLSVDNKNINIGIGVNSFVSLRGISLMGFHYDTQIGGAPNVVGSGTIGIGNANYNDWVRDLDFDKVVCQAFDTGFELMSFSVKFHSVWSRLCNLGFHMFSTKVRKLKNGSAGTTISMINCYADHVFSCGYLLENQWYSQMLNCSCDRVAETSSLGIPDMEQIRKSCAYKLVNSSNCTLISCGAESTYKVLEITGCNNAVIGMLCFPNTLSKRIDNSGNTELIDLISIGDNGKTISRGNYLKNFQVSRTYNEYSCTISDSDNDICNIENIVKKELANSTKGPFMSRPAASGVGEGSLYYDTTNKRMILSNGKAWVNIDGSPL